MFALFVIWAKFDLLLPTQTGEFFTTELIIFNTTETSNALTSPLSIVAHSTTKWVLEPFLVIYCMFNSWFTVWLKTLEFQAFRQRIYFSNQFKKRKIGKKVWYNSVFLRKIFFAKNTSIEGLIACSPVEMDDPPRGQLVLIRTGRIPRDAPRTWPHWNSSENLFSLISFYFYVGRSNIDQVLTIDMEFPYMIV